MLSNCFFVVLFNYYFSFISAIVKVPSVQEIDLRPISSFSSECLVEPSLKNNKNGLKVFKGLPSLEDKTTICLHLFCVV